MDTEYKHKLAEDMENNKKKDIPIERTFRGKVLIAFFFVLVTSPWTPLGLERFLAFCGASFVFCAFLQRDLLEEGFEIILCFIMLVWVIVSFYSHFGLVIY